LTGLGDRSSFPAFFSALSRADVTSLHIFCLFASAFRKMASLRDPATAIAF
jgi:hypothetical protein